MQTISQIEALVSQLRPDAAGREATRAALDGKRRELQQQGTAREAFGRLVEHTREQRLVLRREVADTYRVVEALQQWKAARDDALDEVLTFEREAAQEVIDGIEQEFRASVAQKEAERDEAIKRVNEDFEAQVQALEGDKRTQIADVLDLIDTEPCCGVFKAVGTPDEQDFLTIQQNVKTLKEWAGKEHAEVVYDSAACDFSHDAFNECFESPSNAVVGITEDGDVYGGFVSVAVDQVKTFTPDPGNFIFSLASHRRCPVPQRWVIKPEKQETAVALFDDNTYFIRFGGADKEGRMFFITGPNGSFCYNLRESYDGVGDLWLCGKNFDQERNTDDVTLRRLFVLRLS